MLVKQAELIIRHRGELIQPRPKAAALQLTFRVSLDNQYDGNWDKVRKHHDYVAFKLFVFEYHVFFKHQTILPTAVY
ncbi:hypothetical protein CS537_06620 [Yersinia mollaretii]|nr:hypothetical protein CS537_06620 [Yersinia mollaretii]